MKLMSKMLLYVIMLVFAGVSSIIIHEAVHIIEIVIDQELYIKSIMIFNPEFSSKGIFGIVEAGWTGEPTLLSHFWAEAIAYTIQYFYFMGIAFASFFKIFDIL